MTRSIEQEAFRNRSGSFSMHGKKTGEVTVLPEGAYIPDHSGLNVLEQLNVLEAELKRTPKNNKNRTNGLKGQIGNIKRLISLAQEERKAWVFMQIANKRLKHELFKAIDLEAEMIIAYAAAESDDLKNLPEKQSNPSSSL